MRLQETACGSGDDPNQLPVIQSIADLQAKERSSVSINANASDDGQIVAYKWEQLSGPTVELANTATSTLNFTVPTVDDDINATFSITVTDNKQASVSQTVDVSFINNLLPDITDIPITSVKERKEVTIDSLALDNDGEITSYNWTQTSGEDVVLQGADTSSISFAAPSVDEDITLNFTLAVTDDDNETSSTEVSVNVINNLLPDITDIPITSVKERKEVTIDSLALDNDGEITSYNWTQTSGEDVVLQGADTSSISFAAPSVDEDITLNFTLAVTDDDNETSSTEVSVNVINNLLPSVQSFLVGSSQDLSISENTSQDYTIEITDEDGEVVDIEWEIVSGNGQLTTIDEEISQVSILASQVNETQILKLKATVIDNDDDRIEVEYDIPHINTHHNLALNGRANLGNEILDNVPLLFQVGDLEVTSITDADGEFTFTADVPVENELFTYTLKLKESELSDSITLSKIGNVSSLIDSSLPDILNKQRKPIKLAREQDDTSQISNNDMNLSSLSSSEAIAVEYLIDFYNLSNSDIESVDDYAKLYNNIDPKQILDISALIEFAHLEGDTLDLSQGKAYVDNYLREVYENPELLAQLNTILDAKKSDLDFDVSDILEVDTKYNMTLTSAPGTIRRGAQVFRQLTLKSDGTAVDNNMGGTIFEDWYVEGNKIILTPRNFDDRSSVKQNVWDPVLRINYDECTFTHLRTEFSTLTSWSAGVKNINYEEFSTTECDLDGAEVVNLSESFSVYLSAYTEENSSVFSTEELANKRILMAHYSPTASIFNRFDDYSGERAMYYEFDANGTGIVPEDNDALFTWNLNEQGQVELDFDNGYSMVWSKLYNDFPENYGASDVVVNYTNGDESFVYADMLVYGEPNTVVESDLIGIWDHGFQNSSPSYNIIRDGVFWKLSENNRGEMIFFDSVEKTINRTVPIHWELKEQQVWISRAFGTVDDNGERVDWNGPDAWENNIYCNPNDSDCYAHQIRRWDVTLKRGNRIYVQEVIAQDNDMWSRDSNLVVDFSEYMFQQRINFYEKIDFIPDE